MRDEIARACRLRKLGGVDFLLLLLTMKMKAMMRMMRGSTYARATPTYDRLHAMQLVVSGSGCSYNR